jgi:uncharacterized protein CbrC (UPF0167 family)
MTYKQDGRQRARTSNGRYADMNRCQACGKRLGDGYCSDGRSNGEAGHVLCETCCIKGSAMTWEDAQAFYTRRTSR